MQSTQNIVQIAENTTTLTFKLPTEYQNKSSVVYVSNDQESKEVTVIKKQRKTQTDQEETKEVPKTKVIRKSKKQVIESDQSDQEETKEVPKTKVIRKSKKQVIEAESKEIDKTDQEETKEVPVINKEETKEVPKTKVIRKSKKQVVEPESNQSDQEETKKVPKTKTKAICKPKKQVVETETTEADKLCDICKESYKSNHCIKCHTSYVKSHAESTCQRYKKIYDNKQLSAPVNSEDVVTTEAIVPLLDEEKKNTSDVEDDNINNVSQITEIAPQVEQHIAVLQGFLCTKGCNQLFTTKGGCTRHSNKCTGPK